MAIEGAILSEMLEIVAKRAALRPSDSGSHDSSPPSYPPVSLPILPPSMTQNPLQKMSVSSNYNNNLPSISSTSSYVSKNNHQFNRPRPHHNNNEEVSRFLYDDDLLLSSVDSLMHEYNQLFNVYHERHFSDPHKPRDTCKFINAHLVLVLVEFIILYACVLYYGYSQLQD